MQLTSFKGTLNDINLVPATGFPKQSYSIHLYSSIPANINTVHAFNTFALKADSIHLFDIMLTPEKKT